MSKLSRVIPLLALALAPLLSACSGEQREATISFARIPCVGLGPSLCLDVTDDGAAPQRYYNGIEGFTHQWGIETRVRYDVEEVADPPADGSSLRYVLDEVLTKTIMAAGKQFDLTFPADAGGGWFVAAGAGLTMIDTSVACDAAVCSDILARSAAGEAFAVTFELTATPAVPLRAVAAH